MSNYKRFISYIYCYENGQKAQNIGFARVETSDEVSKLTMECMTKTITQKDCSIYLLYQNKSSVNGVKLGFTRANQGTIKCRYQFNGGIIPDTSILFQDAIGVLLVYSKDYYMATKWDNSNLHSHEVELIINPKMQVSEPVVIKPTILEVAKGEIEEIKPTEIVQAAQAEQKLEIPKLETPKVETPKMESMEELSALKDEEEEGKKEIKEIEEAVLQEADAEFEEERNEAEEQEAEVKSEKNMWIDHPGARAILNRFVRMYPFDDGEIAECVRLEPKDIGLLPMNAWVLGNNSFLMHSYYMHRHIIFAKKLTKEGCQYLLMVPGVMNPKEKDIAEMFGFYEFKPSRRKSVRNGEFGYWYVPINFHF